MTSRCPWLDLWLWQVRYAPIGRCQVVAMTLLLLPGPYEIQEHTKSNAFSFCSAY